MQSIVLLEILLFVSIVPCDDVFEEAIGKLLTAANVVNDHPSLLVSRFFVHHNTDVRDAATKIHVTISPG